MFTRLTLVFVCLSALGCATTSGTRSATPEKSDENAQAPKTQGQGRVNFAEEDALLGEVVRRVGEESRAGIVLMNGLEYLHTGPLRFRNASVETFIADLAKQTQCVVQPCAKYRFLSAPGYEALAQVSLMGKLDPAYEKVTGDVVLGAGMELYNVFAWLSQILGVNIVADNAIAASACGELALRQVSLAEGLEAVLKSARIPAFHVESTDEYILIASPRNAEPREMLLNPESLDDRQKEFLESTVTMVLPGPPSDPRVLEVYPGAQPLGKALESISRQIGMPCVAEKGIERLPVNPIVLNKVRVRTAMNLLMRQWLAPDYGYQVTHDRIVIRFRDGA